MHGRNVHAWGNDDPKRESHGHLPQGRLRGERRVLSGGPWILALGGSSTTASDGAAPPGRRPLGPTVRETMPKRAAKKKTEKRESRVTRIPIVKPGRYADGLPLNEIQYLECKLILRPNHFTSRKSLFDFAKVMRRPAAETNVDFSSDEFVDAPLQIREVLFMDTTDFR